MINSGTGTKQLVTRSTNIYSKLRSDTYLFFVSLLVISWGFFDLTSTYIALVAHGSIAYEANPLVRNVMQIHPSLFIPYKGFAMFMILGICLKGRKYITEVVRWDLFFKTLIIGGFIVSGLNLYAAYLAVGI